MNWQDLGKSIANSAPFLGAALGGPAGSVAGAFIAEAFGGKTADPSELNNIITGDPDHDIKLKQIEVSYQEYVGNLVLQKAQITEQDRASARVREADIAKSGKTDNTTRNLAYIITLGFFACMFALFFPVISFTDSEKQFLAMLIGVLIASYKDITGYYFGSSVN